MTLAELWQQAFIAAAHSERRSPQDCEFMANHAVKRFRERHELVMVDEGVWQWQPKEPI